MLGLIGLGLRESVLYGGFGGPVKSCGSIGSSQSVGSGEVGLSKRPICERMQLKK